MWPNEIYHSSNTLISTHSMQTSQNLQEIRNPHLNLYLLACSGRRPFFQNGPEIQCNILAGLFIPFQPRTTKHPLHKISIDEGWGMNEK